MTGNRHHGDMEQTMGALAKANRVRLERAEIKRDIYAGKRKASNVLLMPQSCMWSIPILELLRSQRRWGRMRSLKLLSKMAISESRRLGQLSERQRRILSEHLQREGL